MNQALIDLQTQLSFQEQTIDQLNNVVTRQQKEMVQLLAEVKALKEAYQALMEATKTERGVTSEIPPHY
ncbi:SlyX family protein [Candidatus Sororendozoicomonas aggregata]|uniref:SlyX family protein n=1 Tax=Candidatus Sororendozoicomonas aggregata TaxID=3073239 RepID=UPI002ED0C2E6